VKRFVITIINGASGIVTKGLKKYLDPIPGKQSVDSDKSAAILGTSHIRKVLESET
jgi:hypothetical protein